MNDERPTRCGSQAERISRHPGAEHKPVAFTGGLRDRIHTVAPAEDVGVLSGAPEERVVSCTADHRVIACSRVYEIVSGARKDRVGAWAGPNGVRFIRPLNKPVRKRQQFGERHKRFIGKPKRIDDVIKRVGIKAQEPD